MDHKKEQRLADLEQRWTLWRQQRQEFVCRHCGTVLGTVQWEDPTPENRFKPPAPTWLRVRSRLAAPLLTDKTKLREMVGLFKDPEQRRRPYSDLASPPLFVHIEDGVQCLGCGTAIRHLTTLVDHFSHASELARLRWQKWREQKACTGTARHVS